MMAAIPLVVVRPDPGGAQTVERAAAMGLDVRHMPLFAAHPLDWMPPDPADFDALMLTSAQAPRLAGPGIAAFAGLPVFAVGDATAAAARAAGLAVTAIGPGDGQGLLDAMTSQNFTRILWLCGRERSSFDARGAALTALAVYAVDPVDPPAEWSALVAGPAVMMVHSSRAAARLSDLVGPERKHLILLAISAAAADAAGAGWAGLAISPRPDDAAMLAEAHALCHKRG